MRFLLLSLLLAATAFGAPVSGTLSADLTSGYTFRGLHLGDTSMQGALTLQSPGALYATLWTNQTVRASEESLREVDLTLGASSKGGLDGGLTVYTYPGHAASSWEPYLGYARDLGSRLKGSLYLYRDLSLRTTTGEAKGAFQLIEGKLGQATLEAALGTVRGSGSSYAYWSGGPVVKVAVGAAVTVSAGVAYTSSDEVDVKRGIWAARIGAALAF